MLHVWCVVCVMPKQCSPRVAYLLTRGILGLFLPALASCASKQILSQFASVTTHDLNASSLPCLDFTHSAS